MFETLMSVNGVLASLTACRMAATADPWWLDMSVYFSNRAGLSCTIYQGVLLLPNLLPFLQEMHL